MTIEIEKLLYYGEVTDQVCGICKLDLRPKQSIIRCPNCFSLFHTNHLLEWLKSEGHCPVCKVSLIVTGEAKNKAFVSYHSDRADRETYHQLAKEKKTTDLPETIKYENMKYLDKNTSLFKNIVLVISGLIISSIAVAFLVPFIIGMSSDTLTIGSIFITIGAIISSAFIPMIGLNLSLHGLTARWSSVHNWKSILFRPEKIVVFKSEGETSNSKINKEIMANDIQKIDFKIDRTKINKQYSQDLANYIIHMNITTTKEKVFTFKDLLKSRDYRIIASRLQELVPFLEEHFTKNVLVTKLFDFNKIATLSSSLHFNRKFVMPILKRSAIIAIIHFIVWPIVWLLIYFI